ncbi:hypothetical protein Stsp01_12840 [Streptomyces sp. NBRC 13847]|uniref:hypothetical protein n=1 Tax=Streptomyces TaxID=1883 RepID=UPI0024A00FC0|nr:hypothetical protein [Streptomyces sp. NBRC 13847]GLW14541.1 hypothetical protein Stsp01_12840 [Streptomyces sp. NBRC 13847]
MSVNDQPWLPLGVSSSLPQAGPAAGAFAAAGAGAIPHPSAQVSPALAGAASAGAMPSASLLLLACTNGGYDATFAGTPTLQPATAHGGIITV